MIVRLTSIALCLTLAGLALAQSTRRGQGPVSQPGQEEARIPPSFYSQRVTPEIHEDMQGVWRIEKQEWNGKVWAGRDTAGFALIDEGHMAIELHLRVYFNTGINSGDEMLLQTGIYRYDFNDFGELETHALIGSNNVDDTPAVTATRPGQISRFRVRLAGDVLILERPGSSMTLRRTQPPPPPFFVEKEAERKRLEKEAEEERKRLELEESSG